MRKSAWFLAASLTTFVITILAGVIYAYNSLSFINPLSVQSAQAAPLDQAVQQSDPTQIQTSVPVATSTQQIVNVSPQNAASIAAKFLKRTDLYSVQLAPINGLNLYKVTFTSGDVVYVSLDGQVILTVPVTPTPSVIIISAPSTRGGGKKGGGSGGGGSGGSGGHEHEGSGD